MSKVIAIKKTDGTVAIMYPCESARGSIFVPGRDAIPGHPAIPGKPAVANVPAIEGREAVPAVPAKKATKTSAAEPAQKAIPAIEAVPGAQFQPAVPEIPAVEEIPAVPAYVTDADGNIISGLTKEESEDDFVKRVASNLPKDIEYKIIDETELPNEDSDFFNAWIFGKKITVDMSRARDIYREKIRGLRNAELQKLDVDYMLADEQGDAKKKAEIAKKKQALRDVTKHASIAAAKSPATLRKTVIGDDGNLASI